MSACPT
jgi:DNA-binding response OmpR family regulator